LCTTDKGPLSRREMNEFLLRKKNKRRETGEKNSVYPRKKREKGSKG